MSHKLRLALALTAGLICSFGAAVPAHPPSIVTGEQEKAMSEEIVVWRKEFARVVEQKDVARLRELYAPSFVHTHGSGKQDGRDARIVAVLAGEPVIELAPVDDLVIHVPGGWTAVATGKSPIKSLADGKTYHFTWIAVYVRVDNGWQLAASQATRLKEIAP